MFVIFYVFVEQRIVRIIHVRETSMCHQADKAICWGFFNQFINHTYLKQVCGTSTMHQPSTCYLLIAIRKSTIFFACYRTYIKEFLYGVCDKLTISYLSLMAVYSISNIILALRQIHNCVASLKLISYRSNRNHVQTNYQFQYFHRLYFHCLYTIFLYKMKYNLNYQYFP